MLTTMLQIQQQRTPISNKVRKDIFLTGDTVGRPPKETLRFYSLKPPKTIFLTFVIIGPNYMCVKILFRAGIFNVTLALFVLPRNIILLIYHVYYLHLLISFKLPLQCKLPILYMYKRFLMSDSEINYSTKQPYVVRKQNKTCQVHDVTKPKYGNNSLENIAPTKSISFHINVAQPFVDSCNFYCSTAAPENPRSPA